MIKTYEIQVGDPPGTPEAGVTGNMGMPFSKIIFYALSSESKFEQYFLLLLWAVCQSQRIFKHAKNQKTSSFSFLKRHKITPKDPVLGTKTNQNGHHSVVVWARFAVQLDSRENWGVLLPNPTILWVPVVALHSLVILKLRSQLFCELKYTFYI